MSDIKPKYPIYIISKGRQDSMLTSRALAYMKQKHYIAIEPQDEANYRKSLVHFNIKEYVTLLILPFSNHGDGPGRARNSCWDHSIGLGATRHWVMDDNLRHFYRFFRNKRYIIECPSAFRAMEDFCDRYTNIKIAGPNYASFCPDREKRPAYVANTRIYSCLLIENDTKYRWRGRYNEDTDLSLRVLKDGDCTVQFNTFLQDKLVTQALKGGNTDEFYHKEGNLDKTKGWSTTGTVNKSQMLVDMHPDVSRLVWRFQRWHHYVDYSSFRVNSFKLKEGVTIPTEPNEYGLVLKKHATKQTLHDYVQKRPGRKPDHKFVNVEE